MGNSKFDIVDKRLQTFGISTRPDDTTALTAGDTIGSTLYFANTGKFGQGFKIIKAIMFYKSNAIPSGLTNLRLHLFKDTPSARVDNDAFNLTGTADIANYLGYIDFDSFVDMGDTVVCQKENLGFAGTVNNTYMYGYLQTIGGFTPTALLEIEIRLFGVDT